MKRVWLEKSELWEEWNMKKDQHGKSATWKECNTKKVQNERSETREHWKYIANHEKTQHEKSVTLEKMQHEKNAVRKKCRLEIVIHENTTSEKKFKNWKWSKYSDREKFWKSYRRRVHKNAQIDNGLYVNGHLYTGIKCPVFAWICKTQLKLSCFSHEL